MKGLSLRAAVLLNFQLIPAELETECLVTLHRFKSRLPTRVNEAR